MSGDVRVEGRESIITDCVPTEHGQEMKARKERTLASMFATSRILAKQQMQLKELEEAERRQDDRQERNDECDAITNPLQAGAVQITMPAVHPTCPCCLARKAGCGSDS